MNTIPYHIVRHIPYGGPIPSEDINNTFEEIQLDLIELYQRTDLLNIITPDLWQAMFIKDGQSSNKEIAQLQARLAHVAAGNINTYTIIEDLSGLDNYGFVSEDGYEPFIDRAHSQITLPISQIASRLTTLDYRHITAIDADDTLAIDYATLANNASYLVDGNLAHTFTAFPTRAYADETKNYVDLLITMDSSALADTFNTLQIHTILPVQLINAEFDAGDGYIDAQNELLLPLISGAPLALSIYAYRSIFHLKEYTGVQRMRIRLRQHQSFPCILDGQLVRVFPFLINDISLLNRQYITRTDPDVIAAIWFELPLHEFNIDITSASTTVTTENEITHGVNAYAFETQAEAENLANKYTLDNASDISRVFIRVDMSYDSDDENYTYRPVVKRIDFTYQVV